MSRYRASSDDGRRGDRMSRRALIALVGAAAGQRRPSPVHYRLASMFFRELFFVLVFTALAMFAPCGEATMAFAQEPGAATDKDFKVVPFDEAMPGQIVRSMPLKFAFPKDFEMLVMNSASAGVVWALPSDLDQIRQT